MFYTGQTQVQRCGIQTHFGQGQVTVQYCNLANYIIGLNPFNLKLSYTATYD